MCDGAVKCRFLFFLREEDTKGLNFMASSEKDKDCISLTCGKKDTSCASTVSHIFIKYLVIIQTNPEKEKNSQ